VVVAASVPIGVQLYSLREQAAADLPAVLERLDRIGFVGVELAGLYGRTAGDVQHAIGATGLRVGSAHVGLADDETFRAALDEHAALGCETVVIPSAPHPGFGDRDQVRGTADLVNHAFDLARERGMSLGYHNHFWELAPLDDGRPALLHFFEHTVPEVFAELDVYWAQVGGADPVAVVTELGPRARMLHVKDGPGDDGAAANVAVGDGAVDTPAVIGAAGAVEWHFVEFDRCDTDVFDAVERSYRYLVGNDLSRGRA
jgi:sugar phosphate isomerase/epimerase